MNLIHRMRCSSDNYAQLARERLLPWVLQGLDLGDSVLEIGPGPGVTTAVLAEQLPRLTACEIDERLARALVQRVGGQVPAVRGDGTLLPFATASFSGVLSFTMLHHVPNAALQDQLLAEVRRVLRPGGWYAGSDSIGSLKLAFAHIRDTYVPVDPAAFPMRLEEAGFTDIQVDRAGNRAFRFRARRPSQS